MTLVRTSEQMSVSPPYQASLDRWLAALVRDTAKKTPPLHPTVRELGRLVEHDATLFMLSREMFVHLPPTAPQRVTHPASFRVRDMQHLLTLLSAVLARAPRFDPSGIIAILPVFSLLNPLLGTRAGATFFLDPRVDAQIKLILDEWGRFLSSADSRHVLDDDPRSGWFGADAQAQMPEFERDFVCDPSAPYYGFSSWDDFFTRRLRPGRRPVGAPDDPAAIVNSCESAPFRIATDVRRTDNFWIKDNPYSLRHMLGGDDRTERFVGGTVYQALLTATNYHRWHSPVDGRVVDARIEQGLHYWMAPSASLSGAGAYGSQAYLAQLSTRAIIFIEADDPAIGLMGVLPVGMFECSTCELTIMPGQPVRKGDELGMFHFGGSTHCLLFRPETKLNFDLRGIELGIASANIPVNTVIARAG